MKVDHDPAEIAALLPYLKPEELEELDALLAIPEDWEPQDGPQKMAYESQANVLGFGGAAGGSKTDLLLGLAHTAHLRSVIYRADAGQFEAIEERLHELLDSYGRPSGNKWRFRYAGYWRSIELAGLFGPKAELKYKGRPHDLIGFDEVTETTLSVVQFLSTWLRSSVSGQRTRIVMTLNPPSTSEGRWVIDYFAPWLDKKHPKPAAFGELRYFITNDRGEDEEVPGPQPVRSGPRYLIPRSRTFILSKVSDNKYYAGTDYEATLGALPEPLRSQMLDGDFHAGMADDAWQVLPTAWVEAAQARWVDLPEDKRGPLDRIGCDVARGGKDKTVLTPRHGVWFGKQKSFPGAITPDGPAVVGLLINELRGRNVTVNIDVIGVGAAPVDVAKLNGIEVIALNGSNKSFETDKSKKLRFVNKRAEWHWKLREALDPMNEDAGTKGIALPPGRDVKADLCSVRFKVTGNGIQIEDKEEIKARIKRSPDHGESIIYAWAEIGAGMTFAVPQIYSQARNAPG